MHLLTSTTHAQGAKVVRNACRNVFRTVIGYIWGRAKHAPKKCKLVADTRLPDRSEQGAGSQCTGTREEDRDERPFCPDAGPQRRTRHPQRAAPAWALAPPRACRLGGT